MTHFPHLINTVCFSGTSFIVTGKTDLEKERERMLFEQWVMLTEEKNAVLAPAPNSGVPGSPADW